MINSNNQNQKLNVYIGATRPQLLSYLVLKYSIEKKCSKPVLVHNLGELTNNNIVARGTPFSLQRLFIPKLNNFNGIAIYLDSDMIVFADIFELFKEQNTDRIVIGCEKRVGCERESQFSVFRIDCSKATDWNFEPSKLSNKHNTKLEFEDSKSFCLSSDWNSLEYYVKEKTKLLHYTDMDRQPWLSSRNELREVWYLMLKDAISNGFISKEIIYNEIKLGNVKPSLSRFCEDYYREIKFTDKIKDMLYSPPHTVNRFFKSNNILTRSIVAIAMNIKNIILK